MLQLERKTSVIINRDPNCWINFIQLGNLSVFLCYTILTGVKIVDNEKHVTFQRKVIMSHIAVSY